MCLYIVCRILKKFWLKNWFICLCSFGNLFLFNCLTLYYEYYFLLFLNVLNYFALTIGKLLKCRVVWRKSKFCKVVCSLSLEKASLPFLWSEIGLTALRSDEVIDLMIKEYPAKHAEYSVILQEKERQRITDRSWYIL